MFPFQRILNFAKCYSQKYIVIGNRKTYITGKKKNSMESVENPIQVLKVGNISTLAVMTTIQEVVCH